MKIFIIIGHPGKERLSHRLADSYARGAREVGAEVRVCLLGELKFDPILHDGYAKVQELEPDLQKAKEDILWADHIVTVYPLWWGGFPALMKGFIDRVFLPGSFFKFEKGHLFPRKLLKGKSGRIMITMDTNLAIARWGLGILHYFINYLVVWSFVGIGPIRQIVFGPTFTAGEERIKKWLDKSYRLGVMLK